MARIIRTSPKNRITLGLRVGLSFLLFLQIQEPNARTTKAAPVAKFTVPFKSETQAPLALHKHSATHIAFTEPEKAN